MMLQDSVHNESFKLQYECMKFKLIMQVYPHSL